MRRSLTVLVLAGVLAASGCGDDDEIAYDLKTPPQQPGAVPVPPAAADVKLVDKKLTQADAQELRPALEGWSKAIARRDIDRARKHFGLPTLVAQPGKPTIELRNAAVVDAFNISLNCTLRLISVKPDRRYVIGAFAQDTLEGRSCPEAGGISRIAFVFGDPDHPNRFTEWWEAAPGDAGEGNPDKRPTEVLPVAALQIGLRG